ncbi:hypothetical protein BLSMQ_2583 [Brevibacterium aurantiacum]|uniref:Uncharacterized protein n=1 Tax=Brevibacterium aurantiacum TaxID=273384 RepID=A0A1D7W5F8_BREAU|nr:hypothetical protein BLSMQ_2583 [Brevibacterium aurantiacum]
MPCGLPNRAITVSMLLLVFVEVLKFVFVKTQVPLQMRARIHFSHTV